MIKKLNINALGVAMGVMEAGAIFIATFILYFRGENGYAFLSKLFPFYRISPTGAFIGLVEGFIDGYIGGIVLALVYNFFAERSKRT